MTIVFTEGIKPYVDQQRADVDKIGFPEVYLQHTMDQFDQILSFLPEGDKPVIIDIGGGVGALALLIAKYYGGQCDIYIVDGIDDPPERIHKGAKYGTANNAEVANEWHRANGVDCIRYISPADFLAQPETHKADLILSIACWPFHLPPEHYLNSVLACLKDDGLLLADVRLGRGYGGILQQHIALHATIEVVEKYARTVYRKKISE